MKAEHRKELVTNTLANRLGEAVQSMKEGPSRGTILLLVAAGLILIVVLVWHYLSSSKEEADSTRWFKWDNLSSPEELEKFASANQGELPGRVARLEEARRNLHRGLRNLGDPGTRTQAQGDIKKAAEAYDKLAEELSDKPLLHQQVLMGAAKAHESLGEYDQARKYYEQLKGKYGATKLGEQASEDWERLDAAEKRGDLKALRDEFHSPPAKQ